MDKLIAILSSPQPGEPPIKTYTDREGECGSCGYDGQVWTLTPENAGHDGDTKTCEHCLIEQEPDVTLILGRVIYDGLV